MAYIIDLKQDPIPSKKWAVRIMKDALIHPSHITRI